MIAALIRWSLANRLLVLLATLFATAWGVWSVQNIAIDALPDLSDTQVIIRTPYAGQAPQIVENQVTYPLASAMLSVPGASTVRGFSFFGDSFVYVLFEDGTDLYWARSRVLEYLSQIQERLPAGAKPALGPDATGVGWVYQYAITGENLSLAELRSLQDWVVRYGVSRADGVSEVASVGGFVKQYSITVDPVRMRAQGISLTEIGAAVASSNMDTGGRKWGRPYLNRTFFSLIGERMADALARGEGIREWTAEVLGQNRPMLTLLKGLGLPLTLVTGREMVFVRLDLSILGTLVPRHS